MRVWKLVVAINLAIVALCATAAAAETTYYVAPTGSDAAAGTKDAPFATIARAQEAVRALKKEKGLPEAGVRVVVEAGQYELAALRH